MMYDNAYWASLAGVPCLQGRFLDGASHTGGPTNNLYPQVGHKPLRRFGRQGKKKEKKKKEQQEKKKSRMPLSKSAEGAWVAY